jgi:hypothetical protein
MYGTRKTGDYLYVPLFAVYYLLSTFCYDAFGNSLKTFHVFKRSMAL